MDERSALINAHGEDQQDQGHTRRQDRIKKTADTLKSGLQEWVLVNKERQQKLQNSVVQCNNIRENSSDTFTRMADVQRIQKLTKESLEKTSVLLNQQTQQLNGLDTTVDTIKKRLDDNLAAGPFRPPNTIFYIAVTFLVFCGFFLGTPYLLEYYDVKSEDLGIQSTKDYLRNYMYQNGKGQGTEAMLTETPGGNRGGAAPIVQRAEQVASAGLAPKYSTQPQPTAELE